MQFSNSRFELKYILDFQQYMGFKSALLNYAKKDKFTSKSLDQKYLVRSLYYDNFNFLCFVNKLEGEQSRIKVRIRCYNYKKKDIEFLSIELKRRFGDKIMKSTVRVNLKDYEFYIENGYWNIKNKVIEDFSRINAKYCFTPITIVEYYREVFEDITNHDIRICFDHNVKSILGEDLFNTDGKPYFNNNKIILEIKVKNYVPNWLNDLIKKYYIKRTTNSKYAQAIEALDIINKGQLKDYSNLNLN